VYAVKLCICGWNADQLTCIHIMVTVAVFCWFVVRIWRGGICNTLS